MLSHCSKQETLFCSNKSEEYCCKDGFHAEFFGSEAKKLVVFSEISMSIVSNKTELLASGLWLSKITHLPGCFEAWMLQT